MIYRGIKRNIILTIVFLLTLAMLLVDVLWVGICRKEMIRSEADQARSLLNSFTQSAFEAAEVGRHGSRNFLDLTTQLQTSGEFAALLFIDPGGKIIASQSSGEAVAPALARLAKATMRSGQAEAQLHGSTFGVYWKQPRWLLLTRPLAFVGKDQGVIGCALSLQEIYDRLRESQKLFFAYFLANLLLFGLLGFFWLHRVMVRPVNKLGELIEGCRDEEDFFLSVKSSDTEFQKLSKSLNRMVQRFGRNRDELRDTIDSLKKANVELQRAQQKIIRAEKLASVGRLSAGIAHEIGNPIGIVLGYFELLRQAGISEADREDYIARAEQEINRINVIIRQLLDLSRGSAEGLQEVSVHDLLEDISQLVSVQPLMKDLAFNLDLGADLDRVMVDAGQLRQVFLNLIINAADALGSADELGKRPGELTVRTLDMQGEDEGEASPLIAISFVDNGPGIPEKELGSIFDPFYTTKEPGHGTGLGLSVSFMLIDSFGGQIKVESREGEGTSMTVILPVSTQAAEEQ